MGNQGIQDAAYRLLHVGSRRNGWSTSLEATGTGILFGRCPVRCDAAQRSLPVSGVLLAGASIGSRVLVFLAYEKLRN